MHKGDSGGDGMNALAVRSDPSYSYILLWDICLNGIIRRLWAPTFTMVTDVPLRPSTITLRTSSNRLFFRCFYASFNGFP